jgi:DNA-binding SARP family transcriptional activator
VSHLALYLFGGFRAELDGQPLTAFGTDKNRALLAYLTLECGDPHRREFLATLLWPDRGETAARNSLRQALYQLNRILIRPLETEAHLFITSKRVQFNPSSDHWIDVLEFKRRLSTCQSHHPASDILCASCLESLQRAIELYHGEVLDGLSLPRCSQFTDWQIFTQEAWHRLALAALCRLADYFEANHAYEQLIACTQKEIELEPWRESAYRQQMWVLTMNGQPERALQQYEALREVLQRELGIFPTDQTRQLYERIRESHLSSSYARNGVFGPPFASEDRPSSKVAKTLFVGRESELARLHLYLRDSLAGHGRVAFISGEAGSGKTALLNEFASRAIQFHSDLLVAGGTCRSYGGLGDPCQPFQELLETLAGVSVAPHLVVSAEQSHRLNAALPAVLQTMLEVSPGLVGALLPAQELLQHAQEMAGSDTFSVARLMTMAAQLDAVGLDATRSGSQTTSPSSESSLFKQRGLFDQLTRLLLALARRFPLLLLLDDLQWLDRTSASLLFYLGGCLSAGRILLLGAYRPEDIVAAGEWKRHPLAAVLNELQRRYGKIQVDLSHADREAFVNAYLDSRPNNFDADFRAKLYRHTHGNALFTVELLNGMQAQGDVIQDQYGYWMPGPQVNWEQLPARVEAVIAERLGRLDRECLTMLEAASVQGEIFNARVLARVLGVPEEEIITRLSGPLGKQHRLVSNLDLARPDDPHKARYQFRHILYQKYLYQGLDEVERARLHQATSEALEQLIISC